MSTYELERQDTSTKPGVVVVELAGEFDLTNASEIEAHLREIAPAESTLVLDLNRVVFVDSAGIHALFRLARHRGRDRLAIVVEPTAVIARTIDIAALHQAALVGPTVDEALTSPA